MNFNLWFEEHKDELAMLLRNDIEDVLYKAWLAGYETGGKELADKLIPHGFYV